MQVSGNPHESKTLEEECRTIIQHSLLETQGDAWHRLDGSLKEVNGLMKGLLLSQTVEDVHAIVGLVDTEGVLHVSHAGRGEAYLIRGNSASQITEYSRGKPVSAFIHISSGPLEPGDMVVLATQRLLRTFTPAQLVQAASREDQLLDEIKVKLDAEKEVAALATIHVGQGRGRAAMRDREEDDEEEERRLPSRRSSSLPPRRGEKRLPAMLTGLTDTLATAGKKLGPLVAAAGKWSKAKASSLSAKAGKAKSEGSVMDRAKEGISTFFADLKHPQRKRRAHLLLLASAVTAFLVVWLVVHLSTSSQRSKTRTELTQMMKEINTAITTAENRRLAGDTDQANSILDRADERAKQVMDNESGLFRVEALDLLDRIRAKKEEINNIVRITPRVAVNMTTKTADVSVQGLIGIADGEFIVYDREQWYHVLLNGVDDPRRLADQDLIIDGANFPRFKAQVFLMTNNSFVELVGDQPTSMKTEDPAGWVTGKDLETYLRYVYILTADNKIQKYERLGAQYSAPVQYNVSGDLTGAVDMAIDNSVYVLKEGGGVVKLLRGEAQPFSLLHAPADALKTATKVFKAPESNFYFLDPVKHRVIISSDGGNTGESNYSKQYVLEGDTIGKLQDLYVDPEESRLYVADEKRVYAIDLLAR